MKSISVPTLGVLPAFTVPTDDPNYWTERAHYEFSLGMYNMNQQGFTLSQAEYTDVEDLEGSVETFMTSFTSWFDSATSEGTRGVPAVSEPKLPSLADIIGTAIAGISGGVPAILISVVVRVGVNLLVDLIKNAIIPDTGDMEEVADILRSALLKSDESSVLAAALLNEDENSIIRNAFMNDVSGEGDWFPILQELLTNFRTEFQVGALKVSTNFGCYTEE